MYIKFEDARESVLDLLKGKVGTPTAIKIVMALKSACVEARPVEHGQWINEVELHPELYGWVPLSNVVCSVCNQSSGAETPYCPKCGNPMDGGVENVIT